MNEQDGERRAEPPPGARGIYEVLGVSNSASAMVAPATASTSSPRRSRW